MRNKDYIAFQCVNCHTVNVFPKSHSDGYNCRCCGGMLIPIGNAIITERTKNTVEVGLQLNGVDEAMEKISLLNNAARQVKENLESIKQILK